MILYSRRRNWLRWRGGLLPRLWLLPEPPPTERLLSAAGEASLLLLSVNNKSIYRAQNRVLGYYSKHIHAHTIYKNIINWNLLWSKMTEQSGKHGRCLFLLGGWGGGESK